MVAKTKPFQNLTTANQNDVSILYFKLEKWKLLIQGKINIICYQKGLQYRKNKMIVLLQNRLQDLLLNIW